MTDLRFLDPEALNNREAFNERFGKLNELYMHWWKRRSVSFHGELNPISKNVYVIKFGNRSINYADSYSVNKDTGALSLNSQSSVEINYENGPSLLLQHKPCYISNLEEDTSKIFYLPEGATTNTFESTGYTLELKYQASDGEKASELVSVKGNGPWEYIQSFNRSAYPDSGEQDGYEYEYLGIPFDNAVGAPKIETGSYTGTGTYGASNPNSLTFDFTPKAVFIFGTKVSNNTGASMMYFWGADSFTLIDSGYSGVQVSGMVSVSRNTMSWYDTNGAYFQCNESGLTYNYLALG